MLLVPLACCVWINSQAQFTPAYWDVLEVKTAVNATRMYEIDFYRGATTIYGHVDSMKFIDLVARPAPRYSVKIPIASHSLAPEEVRAQLLAEIRIFDTSLAVVSDSVLWSAWAGKNYSPLLKARTYLSIRADTPTKSTSKATTDSVLAKSIKALGAGIDNLKDSFKVINAKMDSLKVAKANSASGPAPGADGPAAATKPDTVRITVIDSSAYKGLMAKYDSVIAAIKKSSDTLDNDSTNDHLTLLSALNFDFSGKLTASYLGLFNIFAPNIKKTRWGFITGIEKINYSNGNINGNDTGQFVYSQVNTLLNPLDFYKPTDTVRQGATYLRQYNKYTFSNANTVWSFYIQPLFKLGSPDKKTGVYLHFHAELLVNQYSRTTNIQTISQDTQAVAANQTHNGYNRVQNNPIIGNSNFISGYFGAGVTFYLKPFEKPRTHFFFQPTFGVAFSSPKLDSLGGTSIPQQNGTYLTSFEYNKPKAFYLVRASYIQTMSTKSELIIGMAIRGIFPDQVPQYAAFLGINLDLNALVKLITGG